MAQRPGGGRYFHATLRTTEVPAVGTLKVVTVDLVTGKQIASVALQCVLA